MIPFLYNGLNRLRTYNNSNFQKSYFIKTLKLLVVRIVSFEYFSNMIIAFFYDGLQNLQTTESNRPKFYMRNF